MADANRIAGAGRLAGKTARFTFDGQRYRGREGDTLASALIANGVHLVGRSFKYHRPRGILSAGAEEPNALVTIERDAARKTPNVRATVQELYDGLNAHLAEPLAVARLRRRRGQRSRVADVFGRLLLQDLHVAEGGLEEHLRAEHPRGRRSWRRARQAGSRPLFVALCPLRGAGAGRRRGRHRGGACGGRNRRARHPLRRAGRFRRRAALRDRREDRRRGWLELGAGGRRQARGDGQCPRAAAHHGVRLLRAEFRRPGRARHRPSRRARPRPAARAAVAGPRQARGPRHRRDRAAHGVCRQRPAGHHAGLGGAHLSQPLRRRGRQAMSASTRPTIPPMRRRST